MHWDQKMQCKTLALPGLCGTVRSGPLRAVTPLDNRGDFKVPSIGLAASCRKLRVEEVATMGRIQPKTNATGTVVGQKKQGVQEPERDAPSQARAAKAGPEKTADGYYIIVNGRRWRATDPKIPTASLQELKHFLAKGRSGVRKRRGKETEDHIKLARRRTALAKLGLGERGKPEWWNDSDAGRQERWQGALEELRALDIETTP
jgi:hypothetical protein